MVEVLTIKVKLVQRVSVWAQLRQLHCKSKPKGHIWTFWVAYKSSPTLQIVTNLQVLKFSIKLEESVRPLLLIVFQLDSFWAQLESMKKFK